MLVHEETSWEVIGAAIEVHRHLGPGLLESAYRRCLVHELQCRSIAVDAERPIDLTYKDLLVPGGYRADLIVDRKLIVEVKAFERVLAVHRAQVLTYLRLTGLRAGLLLNFNVTQMGAGITRLVL